MPSEPTKAYLLLKERADEQQPQKVAQVRNMHTYMYMYMYVHVIHACIVVYSCMYCVWPIPISCTTLWVAAFPCFVYHVWSHSHTFHTTVSGLIPMSFILLCLVSFPYLSYYCVWSHSHVFHTTVSGLIPIPHISVPTCNILLQYASICEAPVKCSAPLLQESASGASASAPSTTINTDTRVQVWNNTANWSSSYYSSYNYNAKSETGEDRVDLASFPRLVRTR